VPVKVFAG